MSSDREKEYTLLWDDYTCANQQGVKIHAENDNEAFQKAEKYFWDVYEHRAGEVIVSTGLMSPSGDHLGPVNIPTSAIVLLATGRYDEADDLARRGKLTFMGIKGG